MIPPKTAARWQKLIKGYVSNKFSNVPAGLMLSRLNRQLTSAFDAITGEKCVEELHDFFAKHEQLWATTSMQFSGRRL